MTNAQWVLLFAGVGLLGLAIWRLFERSISSETRLLWLRRRLRSEWEWIEVAPGARGADEAFSAELWWRGVCLAFIVQYEGGDAPFYGCMPGDEPLARTGAMSTHGSCRNKLELIVLDVLYGPYPHPGFKKLRDRFFSLFSKAARRS